MQIPEFLKRRMTIGLESEWDIAVTKDGKLYLEFFKDNQMCDALLNGCVPEELRYQSLKFRVNQFTLVVWLRNGSKLYFDRVYHLEYAAAEGSGVMHALVNELAGDRIIESTIARANEFWRDKGILLRAFKRNVDARGMDSSGTHENYLISRELFNQMKEVLHPLLSGFLASRQIFTGSGRFRFDSEKLRMGYHISQRAEAIIHDIHSDAIAFKAVINTRDKAHADKSKYARLHLICGDALTLEPSILLRNGTTEIVLAMIMCGFIEKLPWDTDLEFFKALHAFSEDPTLRQTYRFGKQELTAINLQEEYFGLAKRFCERFEYQGEEWPQIMDLWEKALADAKKSKPHEELVKTVEWAAKLCWIEQDMERSKYNLDTPIGQKIVKIVKTAKGGEREYRASVLDHLITLDAKFSENCPTGYARILMQRGLVERIVDPKKVASAILAPPRVNRAWSRCLKFEELNQAAEKEYTKYLVTSDWSWISARNGFDTLHLGTFQHLEPQSPELNFTLI